MSNNLKLLDDFNNLHLLELDEFSIVGSKRQNSDFRTRKIGLEKLETIHFMKISIEGP